MLNLSDLVERADRRAHSRDRRGHQVSSFEGRVRAPLHDLTEGRNQITATKFIYNSQERARKGEQTRSNVVYSHFVFPLLFFQYLDLLCLSPLGFTSLFLFFFSV